MRVRVHTFGERFLAAGVGSLVGVLGVLGILMGSFPVHSPDRYFVLASIVAAGCLSQSWTWRAGSTVQTLEPGEGLVKVGAEVIGAPAVTGFSVAEGTSGWNVAITADERTMFLDVARAEDVERIAASLGRRGPRHGVVTVARPSGALRAGQRVLSALGVVTAWLYWQCASGRLHFSDGKPLFGLSMLGIGLVGIVLLRARAFPKPTVAISTNEVLVRGRPVRAVQRAPGQPDISLYADHGAESFRVGSTEDPGDERALAHLCDALG
ncbi:MAG: hypothetical protein WCJ30_22630, partial [Deltaproteobacteria bacterium]